MKYLKAPMMLILFPLDYIGWNLIISGSNEKLTVKESWNDCWSELMGDNE